MNQGDPVSLLEIQLKVGFPIFVSAINLYHAFEGKEKHPSWSNGCGGEARNPEAVRHRADHAGKSM